MGPNTLLEQPGNVGKRVRSATRISFYSGYMRSWVHVPCYVLTELWICKFRWLFVFRNRKRKPRDTLWRKRENQQVANMCQVYKMTQEEFLHNANTVQVKQSPVIYQKWTSLHWDHRPSGGGAWGHPVAQGINRAFLTRSVGVIKTW